MRKLIKYEIKGSYKFILGIIAIVLIASTIIQLNVLKEIKNDIRISGPSMSIFEGFMFALSILVIFGAFLVAFFHIIGSFRKELYEDRGYLTFTLPLSGNRILGAKLIVANIWFLALGTSTLVFNVILTTILHGTKWIETIRKIFGVIEPNIIYSIIISSLVVTTISFILTLVLVYLSITLSRVSVKNKRIGGLWFIVFIILNGILGFITVKVSTLFPYFLNLNNFSIVHNYDIYSFTGITSGLGQLLLYGGDFNSYINIFGNLFQIAIAVLGFMGTGYLIEKKIDL
ncbi:MAG: hypothetical protein M0Q14_03775 [Tissierellaceae bacterium]|nr:hypothetical protein [Tissierellaceae bacterium]